MSAQVEEVKAFKAIDGTVYDTYIKAHYRNIWVLAHKIFDVDYNDDIDDDSSLKAAAALLHRRLTVVANGATKQYVIQLSKELE